MRRTLLTLLLLLWLSALGCSRLTGGEWDGLLYSFESEAELDRFRWKCGQLFALSDEHATHGEKSLRLEIYPAAYSGLRPAIERRDWSAFRSLRFDVFNPQKEELRLSVRIDDVRDRLDYADRYNHSFRLAPGANRICLPLEALVTLGTRRKLNRRDIWALYIFLAHPQAKKVLYFDHLRLE